MSWIAMNGHRIITIISCSSSSAFHSYFHQSCRWSSLLSKCKSTIYYSSWFIYSSTFTIDPFCIRTNQYEILFFIESSSILSESRRRNNSCRKSMDRFEFHFVLVFLLVWCWNRCKNILWYAQSIIIIYCSSYWCLSKCVELYIRNCHISSNTCRKKIWWDAKLTVKYFVLISLDFIYRQWSLSSKQRSLSLFLSYCSIRSRS